MTHGGLSQSRHPQGSRILILKGISPHHGHAEGQLVDQPRKESDTSSKGPINRRTFLALLSAGGATLLGLAAMQTLLPKVSDTRSIVTSGSTSPSTSAVRSNSRKPIVVLVRGISSTNRQTLVDRALDSLGGLEKLAPAQSSIFVKPNVGFYEKDAVTDPEITAAVVEALKRVKPSGIIVGESSVRGNDTEHALRESGTRALERDGVQVRDLHKDSVITVSIPQGRAIKSVGVFKSPRECTYFVSIPRLKRHSATTVTMALKNMMGVISDSEKGRFHQLDLNQCIADLNSTVSPNLVIIDATKAMTKRGPTGGIMVPLNMVIASTDPVAADLVAAEELFKAEGIADSRDQTRRIEHIQKAAQMGIGVADRSSIEVVDISLTE